MTRKTRNDKKDTTCKRCGKKCSTPQRLREHLNRKFPCKPQETIQTIVQETNQPPIKESVQAPFQKHNQASVQVLIKVHAPVLKED